MERLKSFLLKFKNLHQIIYKLDVQHLFKSVWNRINVIHLAIKILKENRLLGLRKVLVRFNKVIFETTVSQMKFTNS